MSVASASIQEIAKDHLVAHLVHQASLGFLVNEAEDDRKPLTTRNLAWPRFLLPPGEAGTGAGAVNYCTEPHQPRGAASSRAKFAAPRWALKKCGWGARRGKCSAAAFAARIWGYQLNCQTWGSLGRLSGALGFFGEEGGAGYR